MEGEPPLGRANNSSLVRISLALCGIFNLVRYVLKRGLDLYLNGMIFAFLMVELLAQRTPSGYAFAVAVACEETTTYLLQPFFLLVVCRSWALAFQFWLEK